MAQECSRRPSLIRLAISVEGPTEEEFVNRLIVGHLRSKGVETRPVSLGGNVTIGRLAHDMRTLFWQRYHFVTSMIDFYGFRDKGDRTIDQLEQAIFDEVDRLIQRSWDQRAVIPYVQRHEFEGLLFSNVDGFSTFGLPGIDEPCLESLRRIRSHFETPEDINDDQASAPSKRIQALIPRYRKRLHGPLVAEATGLERIRDECPRFNGWVTRLEALSRSAQS